MKVPLFQLKGRDVEIVPTEFEDNSSVIPLSDMGELMKDFNFEQVNMLGGLIKRLLAHYATYGMGSQNPGYDQALSFVVRWLRVMKRKAEYMARRKAYLEAYREWSDKQDWGFGMSQKGGLYAPFNGQIYTSKLRMLEDAKALGFTPVGNDDIVADAARVRKQNFDIQKVVRKKKVEQTLHEVMRDIPANTRFVH